jgi:hypothetical protein
MQSQNIHPSLGLPQSKRSELDFQTIAGASTGGMTLGQGGGQLGSHRRPLNIINQ